MAEKITMIERIIEASKAGDAYYKMSDERQNWYETASQEELSNARDFFKREYKNIISRKSTLDKEIGSRSWKIKSEEELQWIADQRKISRGDALVMLGKEIDERKQERSKLGSRQILMEDNTLKAYRGFLAKNERMREGLFLGEKADAVLSDIIVYPQRLRDNTDGKKPMDDEYYSKMMSEINSLSAGDLIKLSTSIKSRQVELQNNNSMRFAGIMGSMYDLVHNLAMQKSEKLSDAEAASLAKELNDYEKAAEDKCRTLGYSITKRKGKLQSEEELGQTAEQEGTTRDLVYGETKIELDAYTKESARMEIIRSSSKGFQKVLENSHEM